MSKNDRFGHRVEGYSIPVLNEREIRAAAGLLFLGLFLAIQQAGHGNFLPIKYGITVFLTDILIRVFVSPDYSPFLIMGRWIVRKQTPEYVGARQKKFAWVIGIVLSATVFTLMVVFNTYSPISGIACMFCLIFLFFEAAFGICIGCKVYGLVSKDKAQYCPGEVCEIKDRHTIQNISTIQLLVIPGFIAFVLLVAFLFNGYYSLQPYDIFGINPEGL